MRLNRFIASSGKCSRRRADDLIFAKRVRVNGATAKSPGIQVGKEDQVTLDGNPVLSIEEKSYWVMNKPPGVITTMFDPQNRGTVHSLIKKIPGCEHLKPVGRLDRDTHGVLIFTDDGDLHHLLTHPSNEVIKEYQVILATPLPFAVLKKLRAGVTLSDGFIRPDFINHSGQDRTQLIIRLHSGKNRIIRRLMEKVGAEIRLLRRTSFAGITNQGMKESEIRELSTQEVEKLWNLSGKKKLYLKQP